MVTEGELLWQPSAKWIQRSHVTAFIDWLAKERGSQVRQLPRAVGMVRHRPRSLLGRDLGLLPDRCLPAVRARARQAQMPGAEWFPGARLNYAEHALRNERPGVDALLYLSERQPLTEMSWEELGGKVRILATQLRKLGVEPGDRVVAYLPNSPEAVIAMLATTSIGAIWSSCGPDFGTVGVLDRFAQLAPKVLLCVDGYQYGGKPFNRKPEVEKIIAKLPSARARDLPAVSESGRPRAALEAHGAAGTICSITRPCATSEFEFEQVPFDQPLWILFSSGTTGLAEGHRAQPRRHPARAAEGAALQMDLHAARSHVLLHHHRLDDVELPRQRAASRTSCRCSTTAIPRIRSRTCCGRWWRTPAPASSARAPRTSGDSREGRHRAAARSSISRSWTSIMLAGSPVTAECMAWFYDNVKKDLWVAPGSGGTDVCTGFVGGVCHAARVRGRDPGAVARRARPTRSTSAARRS